MSALFNQNWIGVNGEPVTGMTPPALRVTYKLMPGAIQVDSPGGIPGPLLGAVFHAYKLFTDAVRVTPHASGYHVQHRTLTYAAGESERAAKLRMTSNNNVHIADLEVPVHDDDLLIGPSGIGLTLTDLNNVPLAEYRYEATPGMGDYFPQAIILRPRARMEGGFAVATGEYKIEKVEKLVGGRVTWARSDGRGWYSQMAQHAGYIWPRLSRHVRTNYNRNSWLFPYLPTAASDPASTPPDPTGQADRYIVGATLSTKSNQTVAYTAFGWNAGIMSALFDTVYDSQRRMAMLIRPTQTTLQLRHASRSSAKAGMEMGNVSGGTEMRYPNDAVTAVDIAVPVVTTPDYNYIYGPIPVSPNGQRFLVNVGNPRDGGYFVGSIAPDGADVTLAYAQVPLSAATSEEERIENYSATRTHTPNLVTSTVVGLGSCASDAMIEVEIDLPRPPSRVDASSATITQSKSALTEELQGVDFLRSGQIVTLKRTQFSQAESILESSTTGHVTRVGDAVTSYGGSAYQTTSQSIHSFQQYTLRSRVLRTFEVDSSYDVISQWDQLNTESSGVTWSYSASGSSTHTLRTIVFYEPDFEFLVYLERQYVAGGYSATGTGGMSNPSSLGEEISLTGTMRLVASLGATEVFSESLPAPLFKRQWGDPNFAPISIDASAGNAVPRTVEIRGWGEEYCYEQGARRVYPAPVEYHYNDFEITQSFTDNPVLTGIGPSMMVSTVDPSPESHIFADAAKDPVTGAWAVIVRFRGAEFATAWNGRYGTLPTSATDRSWSWLVDQTGVKTLNEVLDIPSGTQLKIWESAAFNSMVSI